MFQKQENYSPIFRTLKGMLRKVCFLKKKS